MIRRFAGFFLVVCLSAWALSARAASITPAAFSTVGYSSVTANWTSTFPSGTTYYAQLSTGAFPNSFRGNQSSSTYNSFATFFGLTALKTYYAQVSTAPAGPFVDLSSAALSSWPDRSPAVLSSIAVSPSNATLTVGATQPFTAVGTFSDGSSHPLLSTATTGVWAGATPLPAQRRAFSGGIVNGKLYVMGGFDSGNSLTSTVYAYDFASSSWTTRTAMPTIRGEAVSGVVDGKIYVLGGCTINGCAANTDSNRVDIYDPAADSWSVGAPAATGRHLAQGAVLNGRIYVTGGEVGVALGNTEVYDPYADAWSTAAAMPSPREVGAAAVIGGKLYVIGGEDTGGYSARVDAYDPATDSWTQKASLPAGARGAFGAAAAGGRIYAVGGTNASVPPLGLNRVELYDPGANSWSTGVAASSHTDLSVFTDGGRVVAVAGFNQTAVDILTAVTEVNWSSDAPSVASASVLGVATGLSSGTAHVVASSGAVSGSALVLVSTPPAITAAAFSGVGYSSVTANWTSTFPSGTTYYAQLSTGAFPNSFAGNRSSATFNTFAAFLGLTSERTYYAQVATAPAGPFVGLGSVALGAPPAPSAPTLSAITVSPSTAALTAGAARAFTAIGTFSDGSSRALVSAGAVGTWTTATQTPGARRTFSGDVVNGKLYLIGGVDGGNNPTSTVYAYDLTSGSWTTRTSLPIARSETVSAAVNGKIYVIGGCLATNCTGVDDTDRVDIYDVAADSWTLGAPAPLTRHLAQGAVLNGRIYLTGGEVESTLGDTEVYDPAANSWSSAASMPSPREVGAAVVVGDKLYVVGGEDTNGFSARVDAYDPATDSWTQKASLPAGPRMGLAAAVAGGKIYAFGGTNSGSPAVGLSRVEIYDPGTDTWTAGPPMTSSHTNLGGFTDGARVLAVSGVNQTALDVLGAATEAAWASDAAQIATVTARGVVTGLSAGTAHIVASSGAISGSAAVTVAAPPAAAVLASIAVSPSSASLTIGATQAFTAIGTFSDGSSRVLASAGAVGAWTTATQIPGPRRTFSGDIVNGKLYVLGGVDGSNTPTSTVYAYDIASGSWTTRAAMPTARSETVSAAVNGKIYVIGGCLANNCTGADDSDRVDIYDPAADSWTSGAPAPLTRHLAQGAVLNGRIYVTGGEVESTLGGTEVYDPAADSWSTAASMPSPREVGAAVVIGGKLYVIGGEDTGGFSSRVDAYDAAADSWTQVASLPAGPRAGFGAAAAGGKIYVFGGTNSSNPPLGLDRVEIYDPGTNTWTAGPPMTSSHTGLGGFTDGARVLAVSGVNQTALDVLIAAPEVSWGSDAPSVATVTASGSATALSGGAAQIIASSGAVSGSAAVYVTTLTAAAFTAVGTNTVTANWNSTFPGGTLYYAQLSTGGFPNAFSGNQSSATYNASAAFAGLAFGTTYYAEVSTNPAGPFVSLGSTVTLTPLPGAPGTPAAVAVATGSIGWSWTAAVDAASYRVYESSAGLVLIGTPASAAFTQTGLGPNTPHVLEAAGVNAKGTGPLSPASATTYTLANPPSQTSISSVTATSALVGWQLNANPATTTAEVQSSTDGVSYAGAFAAAATQYQAYGLLGCTTYYFRVRNDNAAGVLTAFDAPVSTVTGNTVPAPPVGLTAAALPGNQVALSWIASPTEGITQYRVFYDSGTGTVNYGAPLAVVPSTQTSFTTAVLPSTAAYIFAVRAAHRCGVTETGGVFAIAATTATLAPVRASIKTPDSGKRIAGNSVTIMAEIVSGAPDDVASVDFQYRVSGSTAWADVPASDVHHPNPDTDAPFFIHWDVTVVAPGRYDLRAVATGRSGGSDTAPGAISVVIDPVTPDINEGMVGGKVQKQQVVNNAITTNIAAGGANESDPSCTIVLPPGALSASTVTVTVVSNPTITTGPPAGFSFVGSALEVDLGNGQHNLAGGAVSAITLSYPETTQFPSTLQLYSLDPATGVWSKDFASTVNQASHTVTGLTPHFSIFAIVAGSPVATSLSNVRVYPNPYKPGGGNPDEGKPFNTGDATSGVVFDNLPGVVTITIYSASGRMVAKFDSSIGNGMVHWDAKNQDGRDAATGGYFAVISSPGMPNVVRKFAIIR